MNCELIVLFPLCVINQLRYKYSLFKHILSTKVDFAVYTEGKSNLSLIFHYGQEP